MQRATYEGQQGYFDEETNEFHPKDALKEATYEGKKGLFHQETSRFFPLTGEAEPQEKLGVFDRIANEAKRIAGWSEESISGRPSPGTPPPEPLPDWKKEELAKPVAFQPTPTPAPAPAFTPTDKFASYPVSPTPVQPVTQPAPAPAPQASILPPLTEPPIAEPPKVAPAPTPPVQAAPPPAPEAPILPPLTEPPFTPTAPQPAPVAAQPSAPVIQPPVAPEAPPMVEKRQVPVGKTRAATPDEIDRVTKSLPELMPAHEAAKKDHLGFGFREDGTPKGSGFLGVMPTPAPGVFASEKSVSVTFDGKEMLIPTLVPTLTKPEVAYLLGGGSPTPEIVAKAVDHAKDRMAMGLSPFYQEGERRVQLFKPSHLPPPVINPDTRTGIQPQPKPGQKVQIPGGTTAVQNPQKEEDWAPMLGKSAMAGFGTLATGVMGVAAAKEEVYGKGANAREIDELAKTIQDYWTPGVGDNTAKYYASAILQSITGSYPSMMLGPGALPAFGVVSAGNKYLEMRRAGKSILASLLVAIPVGLSEALTEKLPLDAFRKVTDPIIKRVAKAAGLEIPGELINTIVEDVLDQMSGMREQMTVKEYMSDLVDTVVTTTGQSLIMFAAGAVGGKIDRGALRSWLSKRRAERKAAKEAGVQPKEFEEVSPLAESQAWEEFQKQVEESEKKAAETKKEQPPEEDLPLAPEEPKVPQPPPAPAGEEKKPIKFEDLTAEAERIAEEKRIAAENAAIPEVPFEKPIQPPTTEKEVSKEAAPVAEEPAKQAGIVPPEIPGLRYDGKLTGLEEGEPDFHNFTLSGVPEKDSGSFFAKDISEANLIKERDRMREKFGLPPFGQEEPKAPTEKVLRETVPTWDSISEKERAFWTDHVGDEATAKDFFESYQGDFTKLARDMPPKRPGKIGEWKAIRNEEPTKAETKAEAKPPEAVPAEEAAPTEGVQPVPGGMVEEPWQMTYDEFKKSRREELGPQYEVAFETGGEKGKGVVGEHHKKLIQQALAEGKPVPSEVLADYPDVAPKKGLEARKAEIEAKKAKKPSEMSLVEMEEAGVEPWQVTQKRWVEVQREERRRLGQSEESGTRAAPFSDYEEFHKREVQKAIDEGKPVPEEVRKEVETRTTPKSIPTIQDIQELNSLRDQLMQTAKKEETDAIKAKAQEFANRFPDILRGDSPFSDMFLSRMENIAKREGAYPDLTVTGGAHEVPGRPAVKYVVHNRKPTLGDNRPFRVVMYQQEGGYLSEDGIGATKLEAYTNALSNFDAKLTERERGKKPAEVAEKPQEPAPAPSTGNRWVRNPEGKYEFYFDKATFDKLPGTIKEDIRRRFNWSPRRKAWVSKASKDPFWPKQIIQKLEQQGVFQKAEAEKPKETRKEPYLMTREEFTAPRREELEAQRRSLEKSVPEDMARERAFDKRKPEPTPYNVRSRIESLLKEFEDRVREAETLHERLVKSAKADGKDVPDNVWKDYSPKGLEEVKAEKKEPVEEVPGYNTDWDRVMQIKNLVGEPGKSMLVEALQMAERDDFVGATRQLEQAHQQLMTTYPELADALRDTIDKGQQPEPEIETTAQALPQSKEAKKYIDAIVNPNRKDYAESYDLYLRSGSPEGWDFPRNLSLMAQQGIRMELSKFYGEGVESPVAKEEPAPIDQELAGMTDEDVKAMLDESFGEPKVEVTSPTEALPEKNPIPLDIREAIGIVAKDDWPNNPFKTKEVRKAISNFPISPEAVNRYLELAKKEYFETVGGKGLEAAKKLQEGGRGAVLPEQPAERPLADIMKEVGSQGVTGVSEAMKGLYELFGGSKLKSFPAGFDQETYAKAKPHFIASFNAFKKAGKGLKDFFRTIRDQFGDPIKPYLYQFVLEYKQKYPLDIIEKEAQTGVEGGQNVDQAGELPTDTAEVEGNRGGPGREGTGNVQAPEEKWTTDDLRQGDGPESSGQLRGGGDRGPSAFTPTPDVLGESSEPNPSSEQSVGGSPVNVAGVQRPAKGRDFRITPEFVVREGSWKNQAKVNLDIIDLIKKLDQEKRPATPEEQALLAKYTGWGASELANNMFPHYAEGREVWPNRANSGWQDLVERLVAAMTPEEIKIAANSTQFAHYTSFPVIRSIYRALEKFGFAGGKILEPGMGVGNFYGLLPETMRKGTTYTGIEYDPITAKIAQYLYPRQNILLDDFTKKNLPNNFFDVAIGNPPFARTKILVDPDYKKFRFNLHEFFFAKSLDKVRPGGVLAFVTSRYAMDKVKDRTREYLMGKADLIGAIRLPQTAFKENAGTEVVTDVLFFRKKIPEEATVGQNWKELKEIQTPEGPFHVNEYYVDHPEMVLGSHSGKGSIQNKPGPQYTVIPEKGTNIEEEFAKAVEKLPSNVFSSAKQPAEVKHAAVVERDFNPAIKKEGGLYVSDKGDIMIVDSGSGVPLDSIHKVSPADKEFYKGYISLRDAVKRAHYDQLNEGQWEESLAALQKEYKAFSKKHGRVTQYTSYMTKEADEDGAETSVERRRYKYWNLYRIDTEFPLVTSLEVITDAGDIIDGPPLTGRVLKKPPVPEIKTVPDALAVSLDQTGHLDLEDIARVAQVPVEQAIEQLGDLVYLDPSKGAYALADEYLSGDVVRKLGEAKASADIDPQYKKNVEALQKVQPLPLTAAEITVNLGAPWVPDEYVTQFAQDVLGLPDSTVINYNPEDNSWTYAEVVDANAYFRRRRGGRQPLKRQGMRGSTSEWSTEDRGANEILDSVLNNKTIRVMTPDPGPPRKLVFNEPGTAAVNDVAKRMRDRFKSWIWEETDRAKELIDLWNTTKNNIAKRKFDGSHLTLPGVTLSWLWHPHQKNGIWRVIQDGNVYLAHAVGSGKTAEYIAAGMEMKRLGLISKPMYSVPKSVLQQFANEFQELYPMANIMVADEDNFHTDNRRKFIAQATLNNPDAVVIPHSALTLLKMKEENIAPIRDELIADLQDSLEDMRGSGANRFRIKQMEARIDALIQRFDSMIQKGDNVVTFEDMGVDFLFYDEAHAARKLDFATNRNDKGIDSVGSARAMDLYIKTKYLERQKPKRSHVFGSGTPVVNTIGELYSIMKFFDEDQMERDGIRHFDAWASTFGEVLAKPEMNSAGQYEMVSRFSNFVNVHELMTRVKMFMDTLSVSQLRGLLAESGRGVPEIQGNKPEIRITPPSPTMKAYQSEVLAPRIEASKRWKPGRGQKGNPDPMINIITDGRLASIDMRFHMKVPNDPNSKLNQWIDGIIDGYKATKDFTYLDEEGKPSDVKGGTLIAFFNLGFGKEVANKRGFDSRAWVNTRLKEAGIPMNEVIWFEDYSADSKINAKKAVIRDFRNGVRRILIGSAKTMGVGLNAQRRLAESHYLDPPWFPADVEQPDGRILRQGNQNKEVKIVRYATKGSYDSTQWGMVARKSGAIEKAFTGENIRRLEDISETSQFEMASALASGDERAIRLAALRGEVENLRNLQIAHNSQQRSMETEKQHWEWAIRSSTSWKEKLEKAKEMVPEYVSAIKGKIGEKEYDNREEFGLALRDAYKAMLVRTDEASAASKELTGKDYNVSLNEKIASISGDTGPEIPLYFYGVPNHHLLSLNFTKDVHYDIQEGRLWTVDENFSGKGMVQKIVGKMNGFDHEIDSQERNVREAETELKKIKARLGAPFPYAEELLSNTTELYTLEHELIAEGQAQQAATAQQYDESEQELIRRIEGEHGAGVRKEGSNYVQERGGRKYTIPAEEVAGHKRNIAEEAKRATATEEPEEEGGGLGESGRIDLSGMREAWRKGKAGRESLYQKIFNRFASIENLVEKARKLGAVIPVGLDAAKRAREYLGLGGKVQSVLEDKTFRIKEDGKIELTGEGLKPILDEYMATSPEKDFETAQLDFNTYMIANRIVEDLQRPKSPWNKEEIATPQQVRDAEQALISLERKYGSLDHFGDIAPRYYDFQARVLHLLVEAGNMSEAKYRQILRANPHYVPFQRVMEEIDQQTGQMEQVDEKTGERVPRAKRPFTEARSPVKKIKGSNLEIHDIIESTIQNTFRIMDAAERNIVARSVARLSEIPELGIEEVEPPYVPVANITHTAMIDKGFRDKLQKFAESLGARFTTGKEVKPGTRTLGTFTPGINEVKHRQATGEDVFSHEAGHFFDEKFGLKPRFYKRGVTREVAQELIDFMQKQGQSKNRMKKAEERFAHGFEWWLLHRDLAERDIPKFSKAMENIIKEIPALKPLLDIRPTPELGRETQKETIFRKSQFAPKGRTIEYFVEGEKKYVTVPKNLYAAMTGLNEVSAGLWVKVLSAPAHWLRTGATITPEFAARNLLRDQFTAFMQTRMGFRPMIDSSGAVADILGKSEVYYDWLRSGAAYSTINELNRKNLEKMVKDLMGKTSMWSKLNVVTRAQDLSQLLEQATRIGIYKAGIRKGLTPVEAGFESREGTVDFARRGSSLTDWNRMTAFFNAGLQGFDKTVRTAYNHPLETAAYGFATITIPSILLFLANKDDPEYKEIPRWQKDLFWILPFKVKGAYVRVPKPFIYGQIFGSAVERFLEYAYTKDKKAFHDFHKTLIDAALPTQGDPESGLIVTGVKALIENLGPQGYSFFRQTPIVPEGKKGLLPFMQHGKYTSETAKAAGKALGYSPAKIENLVQGYFGGTGRYALQAGDLAMRIMQEARGKKPEPTRPKELADYPLVKGFVTRPPVSQPESLDYFYEQAEEMKRAYDSYSTAVKNIKGGESKYILEKYPKLFTSPSLEEIKKNIGMIDKNIDMIIKSPMPELQRRATIEKAERFRMKLAQQANAFLEKVKGVPTPAETRAQ